MDAGVQAFRYGGTRWGSLLVQTVHLQFLATWLVIKVTPVQARVTAESATRVGHLLQRMAVLVTPTRILIS